MIRSVLRIENSVKGPAHGMFDTSSQDNTSVICCYQRYMYLYPTGHPAAAFTKGRLLATRVGNALSDAHILNAGYSPAEYQADKKDVRALRPLGRPIDKQNTVYYVTVDNVEWRGWENSAICFINIFHQATTREPFRYIYIVVGSEVSRNPRDFCNKNLTFLHFYRSPPLLGRC